MLWEEEFNSATPCVCNVREDDHGLAALVLGDCQRSTLVVDDVNVLGPIEEVVVQPGDIFVLCRRDDDFELGVTVVLRLQPGQHRGRVRLRPRRGCRGHAAERG